MAANKWDEDDSDSSTPPSSPPVAARHSKFDDEENDSDVADAWDAAEDSEVEREKAKKAAEAKAKADAVAAANKKSRAQRIAEHQARNAAQSDESSDEEETEAERRARLKREQKEADLAHASDLFGDLSVGPTKRTTSKPVTLSDPSNPTSTIDLSVLPIFNPTNKADFTKLRETLVPLLAGNSKKAQYTLFMQEFAKQICKDLPSDQIKKIASGLTTLSNEKMREEKAAEKGGKKSKAAKNKTTLNAGRNVASQANDLAAYDDDGLGDDDFM